MSGSEGMTGFGGVMERVGVAAFEGVRGFEGVTERVTDRVGLTALEGTTA